MRTRLAVLATVLSALVISAAPAVANAAPSLTINTTANPVIAGQSLLIYGQLTGLPNDANKPIVLFHRIVPAARFTIIGVRRTNALGYYSFVRPDGIVVSNRNWYVEGPFGLRSVTIHEKVSALVSLASNTMTANTGQPVVFTGHISPYHPYQRVLLQEQNSLSGNGWATIAKTFTGGGSNFMVPHRWRAPGTYTLRAVFPGDPRNIAGDSDSVTVTIQQKQVPSFTINSSNPIIQEGGSTTISGVLYAKGSTTTPEPTTEVTLWASKAGGSWQAQTTIPTGSDGSYSFPVTPVNNTAYEVRTTLPPARHTAVLFEGVQDTLTITAGSLTGVVGGTDMVSGTVSPDHTGHLIYLQQLGTDGNWHNVNAGVVTTGSVYTFTYTFNQAGTVQLRARIFGGPENIGGASSSVSIVVTGVAPIATLPTGP